MNVCTTTKINVLFDGGVDPKSTQPCLGIMVAIYTWYVQTHE